MNKSKLLITGLFSIALAIASNTNADEYEVGQKNKTFVQNGDKIEALTVKKGDTIRFTNQDPFYHNIFSLSPLKTFDLGSFTKGDSRTVTFDEKGMVEVECAIHPEMYMEVTVE